MGGSVGAEGGGWETRLGALTEVLRREGVLTDPALRRTSFAAPRHLFTPVAAWTCSDRDGEVGHRIDPDRDPVGWWEAVYSDSAITIQSDDGAADSASGTGDEVHHRIDPPHVLQVQQNPKAALVVEEDVGQVHVQVRDRRPHDRRHLLGQAAQQVQPSRDQGGGNVVDEAIRVPQRVDTARDDGVPG